MKKNNICFLLKSHLIIVARGYLEWIIKPLPPSLDCFTVTHSPGPRLTPGTRAICHLDLNYWLLHII